MSRYAAMFEACGFREEGALGAFLMLGDPGLAASAALLDALVLGGADFVELGIPFSDPIADGPVIQAAARRALDAGVRTKDCLKLIGEFRIRHPRVPIGILTYANIVAARGRARFCAEAAEAGADSLLVADVPSLEAAPYAAAARGAGLEMVMIAAPNTPRKTLARIVGLSSGFTYCLARGGVTGVDRQLALDHAALFADLADLGAPPPVLGFGISTPAHVAEALQAGAAGVISGSVIVQLVEQGHAPDKIADFVANLKAATLAKGSRKAKRRGVAAPPSVTHP